MNVGTVEAKLSVDASDLDKLPVQARAVLQRAEQEFAKAAKGITAAFGAVGSGIVDQFGKPVESATRKAALNFDELDKIAKRFQATLKGLSGPERLNEVANAAKNAAGGFNLMQTSWVRFAVLFAGGNLIASSMQQIAIQLRDLVKESSRLGREQQLQEATFMSFASSVGVAGEVLAAQIEKISGGLIDSGDAMKVAMRGLQAGLQPEQLVTLTDASRQLAKSLGVDVVTAYQDLIEAISTGRSRRLEEVNITVDAEDAYKRYAAQHGKTAEQLSKTGQSQALYLAVMAKAGPVIESNRKINDEFGESMQRLKIAWQDVQETIGVFMNDTAVKVFRWVADTKLELDALSPILTTLGTVWAATWETATINFKPFKQDVGGLKAIIGEISMALGALGVGAGLVMAVTSGTAAFIASILEDVANTRIPSVSKALDTAVGVQTAAMAKWKESRQALEDLAKGLTTTRGAVDDLGPSVHAGTNRLGAMSNQVKVLVPDLKALAAATKSAQDAMGGIASALTAIATAGGMDALFPQERAVADMVQPLLKAMEQARAALMGLKDSLPAAEFAQRLKAFDDGSAELVRYATETAKATVSEKAHAVALAETVKQLEQHELHLAATGDGLNSWMASEMRMLDLLAKEDQAMGASMEAALKASSVLEGTYKNAVDVAKDKLDELNATLGLTGEALERQKAAFALSGTTFEKLSPSAEKAAVSIARFNQQGLDKTAAQAYADALAAIDLQSTLLGRDFDALSPTISTVTAEILRLGKAGQDVTVLQEKLAGLKQVQELKGIFTDVFSSISSAINTSVQGVILGTTTMAKAWDNLWKSIVLSFVNSGIQRLLKGLQDWALDFVFGGSSGGSSGGGWLSKFFGGGSSSPSPTPDAASFDAGNFPDMDALTTSVSGTTSGLNQLNGLLKSSNFQAGVGALLSAVGVGMGVYGLTQGGSAGSMALSAGGTAISAYSLAVSISTILAKAGIITTSLPSLMTLAGNAMMTLAPTITTAINAAFGTSIGVGAGATAAATTGTSLTTGIVSGLSSAFAWLANPATVFAGMMLAGGFADMEKEVEETVQILRETRGALLSVGSSMELVANRFDNLSTALDAAHLPQTLAELQSALDSLPDLALAVGTSEGVYRMTGSDNMVGMTAEWRAKLGAALVAALDAAHAAGIDGAQFVADRNRRLADPMVGGVPAGEQDRTLAMLQDTDLFRRWAQNLRSIDKIITVQQHFLDSLEMDANGMATGSKGGGALPDWLVGGPQNKQLIDVMAMNAQLDREALTIALRNAVVDVGAMLGVNAAGGLTPAGSEADWQAVGGGLGRTDPLPSVAAIAQVQAALDAAGFVPGEYGKALEAYLISIDQNVVNHPMWAKFSAALKGATTGAGLTDALASIMAGPGAFNTAAGAIIGSLNAQIAAQVTARRQATDPEAAAAIDKVLEGLGAQLKAWNDGFKHLYASSVSVRALLPPDLAAQAHKALQPLWLGLVDTMRSGATEQATVAAQLYAEQLGAWGAFGVAIAEAVDVQALVPPDLAARVRAELAPAYDAILATLTEGNVALAMLQLEQFNKEVAAYKAVGQLINTIHVEVAGLTNEVGAIIAAWQMQAAQMDRAVARSKSVFEATVSSGDVQATADAALAYHTALLARLDAEVKAVREIEAAMQALLDTYATPLVARATELAVAFLGMGDPGRLTGLLSSLADIAATGQTAGIRLFAIGAGLRAIIAAIPVATQGTAEIPGLAGDQIPAAIASTAAPFLAELDSLIADALLHGDTKGAADLLKEQASAFETLGQAGIAAVTQWAEQAKATQIRAIEQVRDAQLAAHAVALQAIEAQLQAAQQWLSAVQGAESFVQSLLLGAGSPLNPAEQLAMVKAQYEAARGAATSSPEALSAAIQAAQTYLSVLGRGQEPGKESAAFKAATAAILKDVRGFLSQTGSSGAIKGQITLLQQQLESLKDVGQAIRDAADAQIEAAKKEIDAAAKAIITGIVTDLTTALDVNTARQNALISSIFDSQLESMKAITGGRPAQEFLALKTKEMADTLLAIAFSLQGIQLGMGPANPSAPIRPEAPDRPPDTPMPTEGTRRAMPMGPPFVPARGATSAPRSGDVHVTIGSGAVVVSVAGSGDPRRAAREIVDEINKLVRAGAVGLIDGRAVAKR